MWLIFIGFDLLGVGYAVWNGDVGRIRRHSWRLPVRGHSGSVKSRVITVLLSIVILATLYQVLLGALVPEVAFDARWYHLGLPAHYVTRGHYYNSVADNSVAISGGPFYQEILYTPFYSLFGQIGAKLVNFIDLILLCLATFAVGRRVTASRNLALCSVILVLALPVLTWEGTSAQNDIGMAVPVVVAFYCFLRWTDDTSRTGWLFAGFAGAGIAAGTKVFGASSAVFLVLGSLLVYFREYRSQRSGKADWKGHADKALRTYAICGLILLAVGAAGLIRSAAMTNDPVFPGLYHLFNTPYWNEGNSALIPGRTTYAHVFTDLFSVPWDELMALGRATTYNTAQWGPLIVLFAPVAAISLLWRRNRTGDLGFVWLAVIVSVVWWYPLINGLGTRYLMPAAPLFAVGLVALLARLAQSPSTRLIAWCSAPILAVTVLIGQPFTNQLMPAPTRGGAQGRVTYSWSYLFGSASIYDVQEGFMPLVQFVNAHVPKSARIWDAGSLLPVNLYVKPEVFSGWSYDSPHAAGKWDICSQDAAYWMGTRGIDYFTVPSSLGSQFASSTLSRESTKLYSDGSTSLYQINSSAPRDVPYEGARRLCS